MSDRDVNRQGADAATSAPGWFAFWVSVSVAVSAAVALALAVTTPPRSGPFCRTACIGYPYTDAAAFVPRDYLWMYPAAVLALLFVALVACVSYFASPDARLYGHVALALAVVSATALVLDYAVQLAVVQPSLLAGETGGLSLFSQYNPHGAFIAIEDVGYVTMGMVFLFAAGALGKGTRPLRRCASSTVWRHLGRWVARRRGGDLRARPRLPIRSRRDRHRLGPPDRVRGAAIPGLAPRQGASRLATLTSHVNGLPRCSRAIPERQPRR